MRSIAWALLLSSSLLLTSGREPTRRVIEVTTAEELMAAFKKPLENVTVKLAAGTYSLTPSKDHDSQSWQFEGHPCDDNSISVPMSVGLTVTGKNIHLIGSSTAESLVEANSGYGIYFRDCIDCSIERVTVTKCVQDSASGLYDAAIVARESSLRIANCILRDNASRRTVVLTMGSLPDGTNVGTMERLRFPAGAAGICGRQGANLTIEFNEIVRNSWGVVLCQGSSAVIRNNWIEGVMSTDVTDSGLNLKCDASAICERNYFRHTTDAIRCVGSPRVVFRGNIVEQVRRAVHAQGDSALTVSVTDNVFYSIPRSAVSVARSRYYSERGPGGRVSKNIFVQTATDCVPAVELHDVHPEFSVRNNTFYKNGGDWDHCPDRGGSREMFWRTQKKWTRTYRNTPVGIDGERKFYESAFLTRYGRWAD